MPEFEKTQSEPDPQHNYSPSTSTSKKTGGRRRSGGFKTEISSNTLGIGEVDPSEALKSEKLSGSTPSKEQQPLQSDTNDETSASKTPEKSRAADNKKKALPQSQEPQPSEATLAAIKKVEVRIEKRRQDNREKSNDDRRTQPGTRETNSKNRRTSASKGGLFTTIAGFFGSLFSGTSSQNKSGRKSSRNNSKRKPATKNYNSKNQRGNSRPRRKNNSQRRSGNNRPSNKESSTTK